MHNNFYDSILRDDLASFIHKAYNTVDNSQPYKHNWHIEVIADKLKQCKDGKIKRLIINLPPRSLKSVCVSVAFTAWLLGHKPNARIVNVSYSEELANKLARDARAVMESDFYKGIFKTRINPNKRSENEFETMQNGYRLATSTGGTLTGRGGNFIIIDDPIKPQDALSESIRTKVNQWFNNTLLSRLNNRKEDVIIIVMQRLHIDDLVGFVQENEDWEILSLPAIAENDEKYVLSTGKVIERKAGEVLNKSLDSIEELIKMKNKIGSYNFSAQYQQRPIPLEGSIIKWEWFKFYDGFPVLQEGCQIYQSWDIVLKTGVNNDFSVCVTALLHKNAFYIIDIFRDKLDFVSLKRQIKILKNEYNSECLLIEETGTGSGLISQLKEEGVHAIPIQPKLSKQERAHLQTPKLEAGQVYLQRNAKWLDLFKAEVTSFPNGRHDDQIDALTQLLNHSDDYFDHSIIINVLKERITRKRIGGPSGRSSKAWSRLMKEHFPQLY